MHSHSSGTSLWLMSPDVPFTPSEGGNLQGIVSGPDGNLWVTDNMNNKLVRIQVASKPSPRAGSVRRPVTRGARTD